MKKIICVCSILYCLLCADGFSQNPGCNFPTGGPGWFDPTWDWTIPANNATDLNHWNARVSSGGTGNIIQMNSPFIVGGTHEASDLIYTQDYKPRQGWVLLYKDFGYIDPTGLNNTYAKNDVPVFMLYNKYRSLIRLFIFANNYTGHVNYAYLTAEWESPHISIYNNSLLTMGTANAKSNEQYPTNNNTDKLAAHINDYPTNTGWAVVDLPVHFDPNTIDSVFGQRVLFFLKSGTSSTIDLKGNFSFSTQSAITKNPPAATTNPGDPNLLDYIEKGQEFLGKAPSRTELATNFNQIASTATNINQAYSNKFTSNIVKLNKGLQSGDVKKFLLGVADAAAGMNAGLAIAATVLKVFIGKADSQKAADTEKYIEPTVSSGFLKLGGKITTELNSKEFELQLPGTRHKDQSNCNTYLGMPYYDCALGVVSMQETPVLNKKVFKQPEKEAYILDTVVFTYRNELVFHCLPDNNHDQVFITQSGQNDILKRSIRQDSVYPIETVNSFQINGKLKLAINDAPGLELISAKAALYFEIESDTNNSPKTDFEDHPSLAPPIDHNLIFPLSDPSAPACMGSASSGWNSNHIKVLSSTFSPVHSYFLRPYTNRIKTLLNRGILNLSKPDSSGYHSFQTPFIDIDKFDGTAITIQDGAKPFIKILVIMKPTDPNADQTPVVYCLTYEIPNNKVNVINGGSVSAGTIVQEYPMTCEQAADDSGQLLNITGGNTLNPGLHKQLQILIGDSTSNFVTAIDTGLIDLQADNHIQLRPSFLSATSGIGNMRLHIAPTGLCVAGGNSFHVDHYFGNCNTNPLMRLMAGNDSTLTHNTFSEKEDLFDNLVYLFPNPNDGNFTLLLKKEIYSGKIKIANELGLVVYEAEMTEFSKINLSLNTLTKGIYFLSLISQNEQIKPIKFVVQ